MNNSSSSLPNSPSSNDIAIESSFSSSIGNNNNNQNGNLTGTTYSGDLNQQAIEPNVKREVFKQLELLLLKKRVGEGKLIVKPGLMVTIPQVEKVSSLSQGNVNHNIEVLSNILVHLSKNSLHSVIETLIKLADPYIEEAEQQQNNKNTRIELPSFKDETIESDYENSSIITSSNNLLLVSSPTVLSNPTSPVLNSSTSTEISPTIESSNNSNSSTKDLGSTISISSSGSSIPPPLLSSSSTNLINQSNQRKQVSEDTSLYHLLQIIYSVLSSHQIEKTTMVDDKNCQLASLPPKVLTFLFSLLQYHHSPSIRYKSASCLQVISLVSLESICQIYVTKLQSGKSDDFYREYSTIQKSAKYLEFGFYRPSQIEGTCQYFAKILIEMEKVSRAVFIQAMCYTIVKAFPKMFNSGGPIAQVPDYFWSNISKMYDIIMKWTKKSKLKFICIKALFAMVGCNAEFLTLKSNELLQVFTVAFKETSSKNLRKAYLECLVQYFNTIRSLFAQESKFNFYQQQLDILLPILFPKKSTPSPIEQPVLLEILLAMGRFSLSIVVNKYLLSIITIGGSTTSSSSLNMASNSGSGKLTNDFSVESKAIFFKALYRLNLEFFEAIRYYDRTLWAILDVLFAVYDGDNTPMKYLLLLFPNFCSHENLKEIADKITKWTWHQEQEIASIATSGITKYLHNQPHTTFPSILLQMLTFISNYYGDLSGLCKVLKNMSLIIQEFISLHFHANKERSMSATPGIDQTTWRNLRDTCEGISIYLLASTIAPIWSEVFSFIQLLGNEIFREIDSTSPYLVDYLHDSSVGGTLNGDSFHPNQQSISTLVPSLNSQLVNFLQSSNTNSFQNAISWAWGRLRKRWHPKSQPLGWKNNLAFLLLSVRLNYEQPELSSVEEQLLTDILNQYFQERDGKTNEEVGQFIYEMSLYLHPSCLDCIFKFIEQERSRDIKRKKKETFYTQDYVIIYASQLVDRISVSDYDNVPSIRSAIREMTYFWFTNPQIFKDLSMNSRNHISRILKNFLSLDSKSTLPKGEISLDKSSYTKLIFSSLQLLLPEYLNLIRDDILFELEVNIQKSMQTLILESNLSDFKKEIIPFVIRCYTIGPHIHNYLSETLSILLRRSPKYLDEYFEKSWDNEKTPIGSLIFLRALVINFSEEYYSKWSHNCPPERLVLLCLFHMVSFEEESRTLAIKLSNELSLRNTVNDEISSLLPHFHVIQSKSLPLHIYLRSSLLYSNSMSSKYPWITPGLIEEINNSFKLFPFVHKQSILSLLAPWTRNFWWILNNSKNGETITESSVGLLMENLFNLTLQSKLSSYSNLSSCEVLWGEFISSGDTQGNEAIAQIINKIVDFLRDKFSLLEPLTPEQEKDLGYTNQDIKDTSKMILTFISRRSTTHWTLVIYHMLESLRFYQALPNSPVQIIQDIIVNNSGGNQDNNDNFNIKNEESILGFFEDLSFEFKIDTVIQVSNLIPLLLCNIIYIYGPWTINSKSSKKILNNILLSLVIQQSNLEKDIKDESMKLIQHPDWSRWKEKQIESFIKILNIGLGSQVLEIWETFTLQFALQSVDPNVSLVAFNWYNGIRSCLNSRREGIEGILGLSCAIWKSTLFNELDKSFSVIKLLCNMIDDQQTNHKLSLLSETSYAIIIRLGSILLHTSYLQQFNGILVLLYKCIQSLSGSPIQSKIIEEMIDILSAGMSPEQVVNRGIAHPHTSLLACWFAKEILSFWEKKKVSSPAVGTIVSSLMLTSSMMVTMTPDDPISREFIEYLFTDLSPTSLLSKDLLPLLQSYYHYNVAKTPNSLQPPPVKDLVRVLCVKLFEVFPNNSDLVSDLIKIICEMIKSLVDVGKEESCSFLLAFVNEMISGLSTTYSTHPSINNISSQVLLDFIQIIIDLSQRSNSRLTREEAQKTLPFILLNLPTGLPVGCFDFLKPFNLSVGMSNYSSNTVAGGGYKLNCLFGYHNDKDIINNTYTSLYLINTYLYALPTDSQLNIDMRSIIETKLKSQKPQIHSSLSSSQQLNSFVFSFKKKIEIPKPSQIFYNNNTTNSSPNTTINNNNNLPPQPSFGQPLTNISNRISAQLGKSPPSVPVKGSNLNIAPPIIPPKRSVLKLRPEQQQNQINTSGDLPPPPQ